MKDAKFGMAYSEARWMGGLPVEVSVLFVKFFELGCCRAMIVAPPGSPITNIAKLRDHTAGVVDGEINHGVVEVRRSRPCQRHVQGYRAAGYAPGTSVQGSEHSIAGAAVD